MDEHELADPRGAGLIEGDHGDNRLVVVSTFPVVVPFMVIGDVATALRLSNGIAVVLMFLCGHRLGHYSGTGPWRMGLWMAVMGSALVGITMVLGG